MRKIGVVTVGRSDYGIYRSLLRAIGADPALKLLLFVSGAHLSPQFGMTVRDIEADGFAIAARIDAVAASDRPRDVVDAMGRATAGFGAAFAEHRPDILVVLGDRYEMHCAAVAGLVMNLPMAHIAGGEITRGAIDDSLRHSMTKLCHLHFASTEEYARRILRMGEEPSRVTVCGAPSLDSLRDLPLLAADELRRRFAVAVDQPFLLVTFHPVTLELEATERYATELLAALESAGLPVLFTMPNADPGNAVIRSRIADFAAGRKNCRVVESLGLQAYFSVMKLATAMVGNSSSGIIEAASFQLPVVNIGTRQEGRTRAANVIDVEPDRRSIHAGITRALSPEFRDSLASLVNPYGTGHAAEIIVEKLKAVALDQRLLQKRFWEGATELAMPRGG